MLDLLLELPPLLEGLPLLEDQLLEDPLLVDKLLEDQLLEDILELSLDQHMLQLLDQLLFKDQTTELKLLQLLKDQLSEDKLLEDKLLEDPPLEDLWLGDLLMEQPEELM
jgi:hypothetical protein